MYKISFTFTKKGTMRFISHLDLMRLFMRAIRRAGLPIKMTEGFSPRPKISLKRALKLGVESENEEATFAFKETVNHEDFEYKLNKQLPEGIRIRGAHNFGQLQ